MYLDVKYSISKKWMVEERCCSLANHLENVLNRRYKNDIKRLGSKYRFIVINEVSNCRGCSNYLSIYLTDSETRSVDIFSYKVRISDHDPNDYVDCDYYYDINGYHTWRGFKDYFLSNIFELLETDFKDAIETHLNKEAINV